jgi:hypothetical protein
MNYGFQLRFKILTDKIRDEIVSGKFNELLLSFGEKKPLAIELSKIMELINRDLILMKIIENADNEQIMEIYDMRMDLLQGKKEF